MASFNKFNNFVQNLGDGSFDFASDTLKVMLTNTAPVATNSLYSDISGNELANGAGYTTGGAACTGVSWSNSSGTSSLTGTGPVFTSTGSMGPFRYAVIYDSTTGKLIGWWDYGSAVTPGSTETFTISLASGVLSLA